MRLFFSAVLLLSVVVGSVLLLLQPELLKAWLEQAALLGGWGYVLYVLLLVSAVVFAPVTVIPIPRSPVSCLVRL